MKQIESLTTTTNRVSKQASNLDDLHAFMNHFLHDLRSPLGVIMLNASWISPAEEQETDRMPPQSNKMIIEQAITMRCLIEKVQRVFDLQSGKDVYKGSSLNLFDFTRLIIQEYNAGMKREIELVEATDEPEITTDLLRYREALLYLFNYFETSSQACAPIQVQISTQVHGDSSVKIWDPCMSIPMDKLDKIFTPFNHVQLSSSSPDRSSGLDLYLANTIIQQILDGILTVESSPVTGTIFEITLPADNPAGQ